MNTLKIILAAITLSFLFLGLCEAQGNPSAPDDYIVIFDTSNSMNFIVGTGEPRKPNFARGAAVDDRKTTLEVVKKVVGEQVGEWQKNSPDGNPSKVYFYTFDIFLLKYYYFSDL